MNIIKEKMLLWQLPEICLKLSTTITKTEMKINES